MWELYIHIDILLSQEYPPPPPTPLKEIKIMDQEIVLRGNPNGAKVFNSID